MNKRQRKKLEKEQQFASSNSVGEMSWVTLGEPEGVLSSSILSLLGTFLNPSGNYYIPPVDMEGLSKLRNAMPHHGSAIIFRRNMLSNAYVPPAADTQGMYKGLSSVDFMSAVTDMLVFGNVYLKRLFNRFGMIVGLEHIPAINMRRSGKADIYIQLQPSPSGNIEYQPGEIIHLKEYDTSQQIYGLPDWMSSLQSVLLNEDATLFRRKYYANGAHLGYIFYTNSVALDIATQKALEKKIKESKGVGNFRSLYIHIPNGGEKSVQIIPVGDINQKDEFERIKNISSSDVLLAHRVNGAMLAIIPAATGGFGDLDKITANYIINEVRPMAKIWESLNKELPKQLLFKFDFKIPDLKGENTNAQNSK